jgi:hypothetical protein
LPVYPPSFALPLQREAIFARPTVTTAPLHGASEILRIVSARVRRFDDRQV